MTWRGIVHRYVNEKGSVVEQIVTAEGSKEEDRPKKIPHFRGEIRVPLPGPDGRPIAFLPQHITLDAKGLDDAFDLLIKIVEEQNNRARLVVPSQGSKLFGG